MNLPLIISIAYYLTVTALLASFNLYVAIAFVIHTAYTAFIQVYAQNMMAKNAEEMMKNFEKMDKGE